MGMGGSRGGSRVTMSEINVTPMVDVMLVLLVIFMVTAPLIQQGVKVNLPETKAAPVEATDKRIILSVDAKRHIFIGDAEVAAADLEQKLRSNKKAQADKEVYLHADKDIPYGLVVDVMAAAQRAGIQNVGMITDPLAAPRRNGKDSGKDEEGR